MRMEETAADKGKFKQLFTNATHRNLLGVWMMVKGSRLPLKSIAELLSVSEDILDGKLQTLAGLGLVNVVSDGTGVRQIDFLPGLSPDMEKMIKEFFDGRVNDFKSLELKVRSVLYLALLTAKL